MRRPPVFLIGAGPGDPGLITVRGFECLRIADVVVYDHLIPRRLLTHARPGAELIDVGTASPQPMAQEAINYLLAEKAREGKTVARLKWGDPFVFDRGGEEALFLHEQGVPFEVIPGIPAAIAAPAYAGVPVTLSRAVATRSRSSADTRTRAAPRPKSTGRVSRSSAGTVVCYAGPQQLPRILESLVSHGWPEETAGRCRVQRDAARSGDRIGHDR